MIDRYLFERELWAEGYSRVMGLDEVGRGCLCGPVVAAGVIFAPETVVNPKIKDSKSISKVTRKKLALEIEKTALFYAVKACTPAKIDELNILNASIEAMLKCTESKGANPEYLLIDGNRFTNTLIPHQCIVKGDDKSVSIAAASILAKVYRDEYMKKLHKQYPFYGWDKNVGYPTKTHLEGLQEYGYTEHHRKSFNLRTARKYQK